MIHLRHFSPQYSHLNELIDLFKSKIGTTLSSPVTINAHLFYKVNAWPTTYQFDTFPPEIFEIMSESSDYYEDTNTGNAENTRAVSGTCGFINFLPFGALDDPFSSLIFVSEWPVVTEDVVVDTAVYSDFEPENAPNWYFGLCADAHAEFRLETFLEGMWELCSEKRTVEDVLGKSFDSNSKSFVIFMD